MKSTQKATPILLGAAVCISVFNVLNTVLMNALLYFTEGENLPLTAMFRFAQSSGLWLFISSLGIMSVASSVGGYTAAAQSTCRPYFNALLAGFLYTGYHLIILVSPMKAGSVGVVTYASWIIIPPLFSIVGASIYKRQQRNRRGG